MEMEIEIEILSKNSQILRMKEGGREEGEQEQNATMFFLLQILLFITVIRAL